MLKPLGQAAALILLCALLVYAPEIYTAVSGPFSLSTPERVLLRVVLCTQDDETVASFLFRSDAVPKTGIRPFICGWCAPMPRSSPGCKRHCRMFTSLRKTAFCPRRKGFIRSMPSFKMRRRIQARIRAMRLHTTPAVAEHFGAPHRPNQKNWKRRWISFPIFMKSRKRRPASHNFCLCNASYSGTIKAINTGRIPWTP